MCPLDSGNPVLGAATCLRRWKGKRMEGCQSWTDTLGLALKSLLSWSGLLSGLAAHSAGGNVKKAAVPLLGWGQWLVIIYIVVLPSMFWVLSKG